jgi:hypothetical protein
MNQSALILSVFYIISPCSLVLYVDTTFWKNMLLPFFGVYFEREGISWETMVSSYKNTECLSSEDHSLYYQLSGNVKS